MKVETTMNLRASLFRAVILLASLLPTFAQTVTVTSAHLGGAHPATGTITWQPALADGTPASALLSGGGGITATQPLVTTVTNGVSSLPNVTDTSASNPTLCYKVTLRLTNGLQGLGPGFSCVQPAYNNSWCSQGVCNFDNYAPALAAQVLTLTGPGFKWRGAWAGTNSYNLNDVVSYNGSSYVCIAPTAPVGTSGPSITGNLLDTTQDTANSAVDTATGNITAGYNGFTSSGYVYIHGASSFVTNLTVNFFQGGSFQLGMAFYDANKAFISGYAPTGLQVNTPTPASPGTVFSVPSNAYYVAFHWQNSQSSVNGSPGGVAIVNAGSTLQGNYTPYNPGTQQVLSAAPVDGSYWNLQAAEGAPGQVTTAQMNAAIASALNGATPGAAQSPWAGKNMCVIGDSISTDNFPDNPHVSWEVTAAASLGATLYLQSAWAGRPMSNSEDNSGNGGELAPSASSLAACNLIVLFLGTNLTTPTIAGIGAVSDAPNLSANATFAAQMKQTIGDYQRWAPQASLVWVTPYQSDRWSQTGYSSQPMDSNSATILGATVSVGTAVAKSFSVPVVDLWDGSNISQITYGTMLYSDGVHPTQWGSTHVLAPLISRAVTLYPRQ